MQKSYSSYLFVLFLILSLGLVHAQAPRQSSLLWKIEGKDLPKPSYLYGTIHLICPTDFVLSDTLKASLKQTEQLTLELDMDDPGMMMAMARGMRMRDGTRLKELLPADQYLRMERFFKDSVGLNLAPFEQAKPFFLMSILLNRTLACQPQSYELSLMALAKKQHSEVVGLETVEEQMAVFDSIPYKTQATMVIALMDSLPQARQEFKAMVDLYKKQDINGLYTLTSESDFDLAGHQEILLYSRNRRWIPSIEKQIGAKPTFIAVGAAHLGGTEGIIALLQKRGYTLTPIMPTN
jgi:uncharacterized protein